MRYTETTDDSAVSPVIGVILMVAITVILAAVIGTFVLGLGENVDGTTSAGVSIEQTAGSSFTVTLVDVGNLDTAGIVGPDGERSAFGSTDDVLAAGATTRVAENSGWDRDPTRMDNASIDGLDNSAYLVAVTDGGTYDPEADPTDPTAPASVEFSEECYISHGAQIVSGVNVDKAGIGCSGLSLALYTTQFAALSGSPDPSAADIAGQIQLEFDEVDSASPAYTVTAPSGSGTPVVTDAAEAASLSTGSHITYEADAEYSFVGTVDGSENVVQTFVAEDA